MQNTIIFLSMWLIPPTLFIAFMWYYCTKRRQIFVSIFGNNEEFPVVTLLVSILLPSIAVAIAVKWLGFPVGGEILAYLVFEVIGGWVMFLVFYAGGLTAHCQAEIESKNQSELFGIDLNELGPNQYIARYHTGSDRWYSEKDGLYFSLYRTLREKDLSGEHIVVRKAHSFGQFHRHDLPKDKMIQLLKDYFDNQTVFNVESPALLVEAPKKPAPEVLFIGE